MKILVTGATGNIGRRVVDHLLAAGAEDVRALTTNPEKAALPSEVEVVVGYIGRPETLPAALEGVDRMYLAPAPETADDVAPLVAKAGVSRVVDLSGPPESWWYGVASAVEASGVDWTHLWPGEFMENSLVLADQIRTTKAVHEPYPEAANAPIAMDDVAAVAARVLVDDGHVGRSYELTGPQTISRRDMFRQISAAVGNEIRYVQVSHDDAVQHLTPAMGEYAQWYLDGMAELAEAPQAAVPAVEQILGRPATTFAEWAVEHADEFS